MPAELDTWGHGAGNRVIYRRYSCSLPYFCEEQSSNYSFEVALAVAWVAEMVDALTTLDMNGNGCCKMIIDEDADGDNDYTIRNML